MTTMAEEILRDKIRAEQLKKIKEYQESEESLELRDKIFDMIPEVGIRAVAFVNHSLDAILATTIMIAGGDPAKAKKGMEALLMDAMEKIDALVEMQKMKNEQLS